jgi:hypothetical protein
MMETVIQYAWTYWLVQHDCVREGKQPMHYLPFQQA